MTHVGVVTAANDAYALGAAVMLRSAAECLGKDAALDAYVVSPRLSASLQARVEASVRGLPVHIRWIADGDDAVSSLHVEGHFSREAYHRLQLTRLLPSSLGRVVWLDADIIVQADLTRLWETPLGGAPAGAVQALGAPYFDARIAIDDFQHRSALVLDPSPLPGFRELGVSPELMYVNSGVMLVDLDRWRAENLCDRLLARARQAASSLRYADQDVLNAELQGRWFALDRRWNQTPTIHRVSNASETHLAAGEFAAIKDDPWIVHFASPQKPWHHGYTHPSTAEFFSIVDRTDWKRWRPKE